MNKNMNTSKNRPDPRKAVHVSRKARRTPKGVKSCTQTVFLTRLENRIFRDEMKGTRPLVSADGADVFRPVGKWEDSPNTDGHYFTANVQETKDRRNTMWNQAIVVTSVSGIHDDVSFEGIKVVDIHKNGIDTYARFKARGKNYPLVLDGKRWVLYVK